MKHINFWLITILLMVGANAHPAVADTSILVDEIHGRPLSGDLAEALPTCDITPLTADDFPITDLLSTGFIVDMETEFLFTVPEGAETLYLRFDFSYTGYQLPFISVFGPDESRVASHCEGSIHVEDPEPGQYRLQYSTWHAMTTLYEIGTGPALFTPELLANYDLVCNLWDDTMLMFRGELPPYTPADEAAYTEYLEAGGGFLYVREPLLEMALKPIINIYAEHDLACDVDLGFPGALTYAEPPCVTETAPAGTWLRWHNLQINAGEPQQILYEGKLRRQTDWLQLLEDGDLPVARNTMEQPMTALNLLRYEGGGNWRLARLGDLAPGAEIGATSTRHLNEAEMKAYIENVIRAGGRQAGLYESEIEEFLAHYHWADRWLDDAIGDPRWCGIYRIEDTAYDAHIPYQGAPAAGERVRTLWIWATGLNDEPITDAPAAADWSLAAPSMEAQAPLIYHEYGVQYQRGSPTRDAGAKDFGFLGWIYHDGGGLFDDSDNCGYIECPYFTWTGGHPDVDEFMTDVSVVQGHYAGALAAPLAEQVLRGDDDAFTDDFVYPPGSYPPMTAAKSVGLGRAATIHDLHVLGDHEDNRVFLANVVTWLTNAVAHAPDTPERISSIDALTPNPFNPQLTVSFTVSHRQPVTITVCDLAGKRVATLVDEMYGGGEHDVLWNGQDDGGRNLPSGAYLIHLKTSDADQTRKAMLVR